MMNEQRNELISMISDMTKDAYGFRVHYDFDNVTDTELMARFEELQKYVDASIQKETEEEGKALDHFNFLINNIADEHNVSYDDAVRWMLQADDLPFTENALDQLLWSYGVSYADAQTVIRSIFFEELAAA